MAEQTEIRERRFLATNQTKCGCSVRIEICDGDDEEEISAYLKTVSCPDHQQEAGDSLDRQR